MKKVLKAAGVGLLIAVVLFGLYLWVLGWISVFRPTLEADECASSSWAYEITVVCDCCCETPTPSCKTPTPQNGQTPTPTETPTATPTPTQPPPTVTPTATATEPVCYQWIMHMPNSAASQLYCADSDQSVRGHLFGGHESAGDYCVAPIVSRECR